MEPLLRRNLTGYLSSSGAQADLKTVRLLQQNRALDKLWVFKGRADYHTMWNDKELVTVTFNPRNVIENILEHYGLLFIGALSNFFPRDLDESIVEEIKRFLELEPVNTFYEETHRHFFPNAIMAYCFAISNGKEIDYVKPLKNNEDFFNEFIVLNRSIKNNRHVQTFLSIFSNNDEIDIGLILSVLNSPDAIELAFRVDPLEESRSVGIKSAAIGAIDFSSFMMRLYNLIIRAKAYPILQSAMWHYYGYYFETMGLKLIDFYIDAFEGLRSMLAKNDPFIGLDTDIAILMDRSLTIINSSEALCHELIYDGVFSKPLRKIAERHLEQFGVVRALV